MADNWQPVERVQKSDSGEFRALVGGEWVPAVKAQKSDTGEYRAVLAAPTAAQKMQSSLPMRIIQGLRDPIDAGAQMLSRAVPDSVIDILDAIPAKLRASKSPMVSSLANAYLADPRPQAIDQNIRETEQSYQEARQATGQQGFDGGRLAGNVLSPANAAIARFIPGGAMGSVPKMAATGAALGAAGGTLTPVSDEAGQQNFVASKAAQAGSGALAGALLTPVIGKALQAAAPHVERALNAVTGKTALSQQAAAAEADNVVRKALADIGQTIDDIPQAQMAALREQVRDSLMHGKKLDAAAALRKADFDAAGMPATQGQITRDPTQFARERNLRGVAGVGEPLQATFTGQNQELQRRIVGMAAGASDEVTAGERLAQALQGTDARLKGRVDNAYGLARDSLGRAAPMDAAEFSRLANNALDEGMLGHYLPAEARSLLNGVSRGDVPFNVQTSVQMDQILSAAQRSAGQGSPQALAIGKVRDALNRAPIADNVGQDAKNLFDTARGLARERFQLQDAIPALKAAANGDVAPDAFVRKFVINGNTDEVRKMAKVLSPEAFQEAKSQIGATLQRAAFGENTTGDKLLTPERLAKALRDIGPQKMRVFFSPDEVDQINRLTRIGSYINSVPGAAAVNTSNTASAAMNLAGAIPNVGNKIRLLAALTQPILNQRAVNAAVNPAVPSATNVSPEAIRRAQLAAALSGLLGGQAAGSSLGQ